MARNNSLVAVTDETAELADPTPMSVLDFDDLVRQSASSAADGSLGVGAEPVNPDELMGVPFVIVAIHVNDGDFGYFVSVEAKLADGRLVVFNDGSSGVARQLVDMDDGEVLESIKLPMYVPAGLRQSEYDTANCPKCKATQPRKSRRQDYPCRACGEAIPHTLVNGKAHTNYISTKSKA